MKSEETKRGGMFVARERGAYDLAPEEPPGLIVDDEEPHWCWRPFREFFSSYQLSVNQ